MGFILREKIVRFDDRYWTNILNSCLGERNPFSFRIQDDVTLGKLLQISQPRRMQCALPYGHLCGLCLPITAHRIANGATWFRRFVSMTISSRMHSELLNTTLHSGLFRKASSNAILGSMRASSILLCACLSALFLAACEPQADRTIVRCEGTDEVFVLPDLNGNPPPGAGEKVHLARIAGDEHCYPAEQFAHESNPDACGQTHYHNNKTALGGFRRIDGRQSGCGVATTNEVTDFFAYRFVSVASSSSASAAWGHKPGEVCNCTPSAPCCGPDVTSQYHGVFEKIVHDWNDEWNDTERKNLCETIVDVQYASDSWDIREFYNGDVIAWAAPGCKEGTCDRTVLIAGVCWIDMVANYAMWGVMVKMCEDISVGPYDRALLDGVAKWGWTRVVSPLSYGGNPHAEGQDAMAEAGYEATQKIDDKWVFRSPKFDKLMKAKASVSVTKDCGKCDHRNLMPVSPEFRYRWRNEG